ncbi:hypothetical protein [Spongiimicrobium sp. 3-5]|uniref:hypothetical protein n=1 Tax=Spongiimicrobium sp. 3-5 TaxID=3332596 RepID=UPI00397EE280
MGGEGSMASAILSLKQNRALLRKRSFKEVRDLYLQGSEKTKIDFKKVSPEELALIKQRIRRQHRKSVKQDIIITLVSIALSLGLIYFIFWWSFL